MLTCFKRLTIAIAILITSSSAFAAPVATVTVRATSEIVAATFTLGDLITIKSSDKTAISKIKEVSMGYSPLPGKSRTIYRDRILTAIRRAGYDDTKIKLSCPEEITVTRGSATVSADELLGLIREYVLNTGIFQTNIEIEFANKLSDINVPKGNLDTRVKSSNLRIRKGKNTIPVELVVDEKIVSTVYVMVNIKVFADVLIATQAIDRSSVVDSANTTFKTIEVTNMSDDYITSLPNNALEATTSIMSGSIIRKNSVTQPPVVRSGDSVLVLVTSGDIKISEKGLAAQDGRLGDQIKVKLDGNREVSGKVTAPGLVEIKSVGSN